MSFYDDASLVFLAGGAAGKDGKAYSLKPTDGSGDFTFSRGTNLTATRVAPSGYIEKGRENLLLQSNQFDTTWTLNSASLTSGQAGYDGSNDAWELKATGDGVTNLARVTQTISLSGVSTFSVYVKAGNVSWVRLNALTSGTNVNNYFDLSGSGAVGASPSPAVLESKIESIGDNWFRISLTSDGAAAITEVRIQVAEADGDDKPPTNSYIYIQDAQLEYGLVATDYIETGSSTASAGLLEDEPRFDYTGGGCPALLMEPTRTNLVNQSEYFDDYLTAAATVTQNALVSPEGLQNASTLDVTANVGSMYTESGNGVESVTASTVYTFSFYVKQGTNTENYLAVRDNTGAAFIDTDVAYTASSSEWTRVEHTFTTPAGCVSVRLYPQRYSSGGQGTTHFWGIQLEEGSFATSYIPTYGSSATRAKEGFTDSYDQIALLDLSSIGVDGEDVSWFFELKNNQDIARDSAATTIRVSSNTSNLGSLRIYRASSGVKQLTVFLQNGSGTHLVLNGYEMTSENPKVVVKRTWSTGRIQVYVDGASVIDETDLNYNAWYKLELGGAGSTLELKQVLAFPTVLSDAECIALTTP